MTGLISFLGGSAFRLIFGWVMEYLNKKQEHAQEMARLEQQSRLDAERHMREIERVRLLHEQGIKEITIKSEADQALASLNAFAEAVKLTGVKTGVRWVDAWNAVIRPLGASLSLAVWVLGIVVAMSAVDSLVSVVNGKVVFMFLTDFDYELIAAFLGVFIGERIHNNLRK